MYFSPEGDSDAAGMLLFKDERHFYFLNVRNLDGVPSVCLQTSEEGSPVLASAPLPKGCSFVELGVEEWAPRLAFDGGREFLLELDPMCTEATFRDYERTIFELQGLGYDVIIAHPERYRAIQQNADIAVNLVRMGCKLQASADFVAGGRLGKEKRPAKKLFDQLLYRFIASDAHRPEHYAYLASVAKEYPTRGAHMAVA